MVEAVISQPSVAHGNGATPADSYSLRPPSPPFIHIPPHSKLDEQLQIRFMPSLKNADSLNLSPEDVARITYNTTQRPVNQTSQWSYEQRRTAQRILDFVYLGPRSVARDHAYLRSKGITMILICQQQGMVGTRLNSVEKAAEALNIQIAYLAIGDLQQIIRAFSEATCTINSHLLSINNEHVRGKVLVVCETGSEISAAVVAAYIMAMYDTPMVLSLQFISVQRFCCCFDEEMKRKLLAWQDLLDAQSQVAAQNKVNQDVNPIPMANENHKRQIDEVRGVNQSNDEADVEMTDAARFEGRNDFAPFLTE